MEWKGHADFHFLDFPPSSFHGTYVLGTEMKISGVESFFSSGRHCGFCFLNIQLP